MHWSENRGRGDTAGALCSPSEPPASPGWSLIPAHKNIKATIFYFLGLLLFLLSSSPSAMPIVPKKGENI